MRLQHLSRLMVHGFSVAPSPLAAFRSVAGLSSSQTQVIGFQPSHASCLLQEAGRQLGAVQARTAAPHLHLFDHSSQRCSFSSSYSPCYSSESSSESDSSESDSNSQGVDIDSKSSTGGAQQRRSVEQSGLKAWGRDDEEDDDDYDQDDDVDNESDDEVEGEHWAEYREVTERDDDDADSSDASIPEQRRAFPEQVRKTGHMALQAAEVEDNDDDMDPAARARALAAAQERDYIRQGQPLRELFEQRLDEYAARVTGLKEMLSSKEGRKLTRKERAAKVAEQGALPEMQIPGAEGSLPHLVERGIDQLEALSASGEWCLSIVDIKMTSTQTAQGRKSRFSAMVMVGNLNGKGGYGIGVSKETNAAIFKAVRFAILGAINIPLYRGHTLYYPSKSKYIRTKLSIFPRPSDFGITASPVITEACELLGIKNLTVKTHNSRNLRNVVKGFFQAIANIPTAAEVAEAKGVYMREVLSSKLYHKGFV